LRIPALALSTFALGLGLVLAPASKAQETLHFEEEVSEPAPYRFGLEVKANYRDSEDVRFPNPFFAKLDPTLPFDEPPFALSTVDPGSHFEISVVTLRLDARWSDQLAGRLKLDFIDRYDRNPSSTGDEVDVDELWLRWGREIEPGTVLPEERTGYIKIGKFGKFDRQNDRHLESYGLLSTAFNRFEDIGLEAGFDVTSRLYVKTSYTQGNPVFIRDPNALAGDNGLDTLLDTPPTSELGPGIVFLYDTDTDFEDVDFENPEYGLGLGVRFGDERIQGDVLGWYYRRDLAATVDFDGTFYGGDLDVLLGPELPNVVGEIFRLVPITDDDKIEYGANLWLYSGGFSFFGQYAYQDLAGLERDGFEVELAWAFDLPLFAAVGGHQLFGWIAPAVRYSELDNDFGFDPATPHPAVSTTWDWEKLDLGIRLGVWKNVDLTIEWADNEFVRAGQTESADEFLATLRFGWDREFGN